MSSSIDGVPWAGVRGAVGASGGCGRGGMVAVGSSSGACCLQMTSRREMSPVSLGPAPGSLRCIRFDQYGGVDGRKLSSPTHTANLPVLFFPCCAWSSWRLSKLPLYHLLITQAESAHLPFLARTKVL